jgi:predicted DCC family thiol-disulfide oxidoreductase YuxK
MSARSKIFVDGNCVVCSFEIAHYKRKAPDCFDLVDISDERFMASAHGVDAKAVNRHLHVTDPGGRLHVGVDAFAHIWSRIPAYRPLSRIIRWPLINQLARLSYALFVVIRPWLPKKIRR